MAKRNILKGKRRGEYVAVTYCDFGDPSRKAELRRHYSIATAMRAYAELWDRFCGLKSGLGRRGSMCHVWVEPVLDQDHYGNF